MNAVIALHSPAHDGFIGRLGGGHLHGYSGTDEVNDGVCKESGAGYFRDYRNE